MKIITIVGARPQFVKAAVVSRAIARYNADSPAQLINEKIIHTGQHYDANMSEIFFQEMQIPKPDFYLGVGGDTHGAMTGRMLEKIEAVLLKEQPDIVLVYGDTNSTLAGALAAVKLHIPVAHVEAGLRSFNMQMPEEINRILTDRVSKWLFCPTETAIENLKRESFENLGVKTKESDPKVFKVGDVMLDAALYYQIIARPTADVENIINKLNGNFYLSTVHRSENTDDPLRLSNIVSALDQISESTSVLMPVHPRTRKFIAANNIKINNIQMIEPVGYFDMITLLKHCRAVFTDSGGVQKEAYFFKKPCITLRDETEWIELVKHSFNKLVGANKEEILKAEKSLANKEWNWDIELYGQGNAGEKIVQKLING